MKLNFLARFLQNYQVGEQNCKLLSKIAHLLITKRPRRIENKFVKYTVVVSLVTLVILLHAYFILTLSFVILYIEISEKFYTIIC